MGTWADAGKSYNQWQNELRHFAVNGLFDIFMTSKGEKIGCFSSPIPSMQCCATVRAIFKKQQTPQLWMAGQGRGVDSYAPWSYPVWVQFCCQLCELQKWPQILKKINSTHVFMLACKTPGGFLFAMINIIMPILEQLEYGDFVVFSAWHLVSCLTCLDIVRCGVSYTMFYSFPYQNKLQSE